MRTIGVLFALALAAGCAPRTKEPRSLVSLYADDVEALRDVSETMILLPGVLGTQLLDPEDGRLYWGEAMDGAARPTTNRDDALKLALPMRKDAAFADLGDELRAGRVLLSVLVHFAGAKIYVRAYPGVFAGVMNHLLQGSDAADVRVGPQLDLDDMPPHEFGYDWRRDLCAELARLDARVNEQYAEREKLTGDGRIDLMAHSMGTQITRYYLRYGTQPLPEDGSLPELTWAGAEKVNQAILIAPPNAGSPILFENLVHGKHVASGLPYYPSALISTFPSLFYMLPRVRHQTVVWSDTGEPVDIFDMDLWRHYGWGALAPEQDEMLSWILPDVVTRDERLAIVEDHIAKSLRHAEQFQRAMDLPARPPPHLQLHLFAGDAQPTPSVFEVDRATGEVRLKESAPGDGEVTRASALLDERAGGTLDTRMQTPISWHSVHFNDGTHLDMTGRPQVLDDVLYLLLQSRRDAPAE